MLFETNEGWLDRIIRAAVGIALFAFGVKTVGKFKTILLFMSGTLSLSAVSGYCPAYLVLGIDTTGEGCCCDDDCCCGDDDCCDGHSHDQGCCDGHAHSHAHGGCCCQD